MFNLEQSITEWRRQMRAAGVKNPNVLDELESHLREELDQQAQSGESAEHAFEKAVKYIGQPAALLHEFAKAGATQGTCLQKWKGVILRFIGVPGPSPHVLSAGVREVLERGAQEARGFHHDFIGTEHILLGLLETKTGVVPSVLQRMGVDHKIVRSEIEKIVGLWPAPLDCHALRYTPRVKKAIALAGMEARALKETQVGAEHLFLGLLQEGGGVAAVVLKKLGINIRTAREEIVRESGRNQDGV